ncbi:hypothetical protein JYU34_015944 [Plutella xylostella]|uniref:Uncharacterized protein n=1 Tax=Plutella xylostella TaxID=51655 RepID=A0ABQ7Q655_PLUXY|nr:hypothetical protein JYU34_015944 [Plutella xylostella]
MMILDEVMPRSGDRDDVTAHMKILPGDPSVVIVRPPLFPGVSYFLVVLIVINVMGDKENPRIYRRGLLTTTWKHRRFQNVTSYHLRPDERTVECWQPINSSMQNQGPLPIERIQ